MYQVLIIGCGQIAGGYDAATIDGGPVRTHAAAYRADPRFGLAGCVDPDSNARNAFAARWDIPHAAARTSAFAGSPIDVISICSPTAHHAAAIDDALALGPKLIFCEKPLADDPSLAAELIGRCAAKGVALAVNYTRRWAPDVVRLAGELKAGTWGQVRSASGTYGKGVMHNGSHLIDLLNILFGPAELIAAGAPVNDFWPDDPTVPALLEAGHIPITLAAGHAADYALFELVIVTERGEIAMRDGGLNWTFRRAVPSTHFSGYHTLGAFEHRAGEYDAAMPTAIGNLGDYLDSGAPLASTGETALAAQLLCGQMRSASLSNGRKA